MLLLANGWQVNASLVPDWHKQFRLKLAQAMATIDGDIADSSSCSSSSSAEESTQEGLVI